MKKTICLLLLAGACSAVSAQSNSWFRYSFPDSLPAAYQVDAKATQQKLLKSEKFDRSIVQRDKERYASDLTYAKQSELSYGNVYYNWNEMESYLNAILQRLLPQKLKGNPGLKVYVNRSSDINAFAIHDGSLFCNVGLFAEMPDEAAVAFVLAHELGHYLEAHVKTGYFNRLREQNYLNRKLRVLGSLIELKNLAYSRQQELEADSLGLELFHAAGYSLESAIRVTDELIEVTKRYAGGDQKKYSTNSIKRSTHPHPEDRKSTLQALIEKKHWADTGAKYLVDEKLFHQLSDQSAQETINILFANNDVYECLEIAFKHYALYPHNKENVYYVLESIRKLMYLYPNSKNTGFLTGRVKKANFDENEGILKNLNFLFFDDSLSIRQVKDTALLNSKEPPFETYDQAFEYFAAIANTDSITEAYLTQALYYDAGSGFETGKFLDKYIATPDAKHRRFAEQLRKNDLELKGKKSLLVVDKVSATTEEFYGYISQSQKMEEQAKSNQKALKTALKTSFPNKELLFVPVDYKNRVKESVRAMEMINVLKNIRSQNFKEVKLAMYEPAYWDYFDQHQYSSVDYVQVSYLDRRCRRFNSILLLPPATFFYAYYVLSRLMYTPDNAFRYNKRTLYASVDLSMKGTNFYAYQQVTHGRLSESNLVKGIGNVLKEADKLRRKEEKSKKN